MTRMDPDRFVQGHAVLSLQRICNGYFGFIDRLPLYSIHHTLFGNWSMVSSYDPPQTDGKTATLLPKDK